jgi:hypothetical protein
MRKTSILLVLLVGAVLVMGCGGNQAVEPEVQRHKSELNDIYTSYFMYSKRNQRPPQKMSDIMTPELMGESQIGLQALKEGQYAVVWGVDVSGKDPSKVVAYEKDAPKQGGAVIMADGIVKDMTADELEAALPKK